MKRFTILARPTGADLEIKLAELMPTRRRSLRAHAE
jgi:hypothetical protein